jgi:hypothetical protein
LRDRRGRTWRFRRTLGTFIVEQREIAVAGWRTTGSGHFALWNLVKAGVLGRKCCNEKWKIPLVLQGKNCFLSKLMIMVVAFVSVETSVCAGCSPFVHTTMTNNEIPLIV